MPFRQDVAERWHQIVQVSREKIFGVLDEKCRPIDRGDDADTMFAGYVGKDYVPGDCLIVPINPGGGGNSARNSQEDDRFYELLRAFKNSNNENLKTGFEAINQAFVPLVQTWPIWTILEPTIQAAGRKLNHIAYLNAVPYRTRENDNPPTAARRNAWDAIVAPSLEILRPGKIIAIGKTLFNQVIKEYYKGEADIYCVRRIRGDHGIHKDAQKEFERLRAERGQP
jgi:hypothetical protein